MTVTAPAPTGSTYNDDQVRAMVTAAVAEATGPLRTEVERLRAAQEEEALTERITTAVAEAAEPLRTELASVRSQLDAAVLETAAEKARADGLVAEQAAAAQATEVAARRDARLQQVKDTGAPFTEKYLGDNAQRWAEMDEAAFAAALVDYASSAPAGDGTNTTTVPTTTALTAALADTAGPAMAAAQGRPGTKPRHTSANISALGALRRQGIDIRNV